MEYVSGLLDEIGLNRDRVQMVNLSSAMAIHFAETVAGMTDRIRELGPNPLCETREQE
jgi:coenzyme F420-reducing hydrogenase delta subunit